MVEIIEKNHVWNMRCLIDESFVLANKQNSILYCRLSDFKLYVFLGSSILKRNFCPFAAAATFTVGTFEVQHPMIFAQWPSIYVYICNGVLWIMGHNGTISSPKELLKKHYYVCLFWLWRVKIHTTKSKNFRMALNQSYDWNKFKVILVP